ncbi:MAG: putative PEP-binding protein, partial [Arenicellales bacterium]
VLDIGRLRDHADFVAIGCNDLMQGLYAADRDRPELHHYLDPYAPVLFRFFKQVAEQSAEHLELIQLCGVLPQIQGVLAVLLGLGYRTFSVDASFIPYLANTVVDTTRAECELLAEQVCAASTTQEVLEILGLPTDRHPPFLI